MSEAKLWAEVNRELIAKAIGELTFEQVLNPQKDDPSQYTLSLQSGVKYTFEGWMTTWEYLRIKPQSLKRNDVLATQAAQFFLDTQKETGMDDIILGNFFEEMHNTLYSDLVLKKKTAAISVKEIANWSGDEIQTILNGHPKILLNKGRVGWNAEDLDDFAPESNNKFQLHWLGINKDLLNGACPDESLLLESLSILERKAFIEKLDTDKFAFIPVHPWQWKRFIRIQFADLISNDDLVYLGPAGDFYRPQISLRTLSNVDRKNKTDIKLPLSVLNTSCVRGLPSKTVALGPKISEALSKICKGDSFLSSTEVLTEKAGATLIHPEFEKIKNAPYRYHEFLGAVWRESSESKLQKNEKAILTASLFFQDSEKRSLIGEYIALSGLSKEEWLEKYFKVIVLPLYHLQLEYGIGLVAHGQNIMLKMTDYVPSGLILKDFQGDLRLLDKLPPKTEMVLKEIKEGVVNLPAHYLIHDLITGHFVTVLRFISATMSESEGLAEKAFYSILRKVLVEYTKDKVIDPHQNLLAETFQRVLLNKVRFTIGYGDSSMRPLPQLGTNLNNPING